MEIVQLTVKEPDWEYGKIVSFFLPQIYLYLSPNSELENEIIL